MAGRVNWPQYDALISSGLVSLTKIAALAGCSHAAVFKRREKLEKLAAERKRAEAEAAVAAHPAEAAAAKARESAEDYDGVFVAVNVKSKKARLMLSSSAADIDAGEVEVFVNYEHKTTARKIERAAAGAVMGAVKADLQVPLVVDMTNDGRARRNWMRFIAEYRARPARRED